MKNVAIGILLFLCLALALRATHVARQYRAQAFHSDSLAAVNDTARMLALRSLDSTQTAYQLRIVQVELKRDSLDRELRERPVVRVSAGLRIDTLRITDTVPVPVIVNDTIRTYAFEGSDGPFAFRGDARINPSGRGLFDVRVNLTRPVPVFTRITCGSSGGIRSASVLLVTENPFSLVPESVEQDPTICNPPPQPIFSFSKGKVVWGGLGILIGVLSANIVDDGFRKAWY
jgi:hypothetical protein